MKNQDLILKYAVGIDIAKADFKACMVNINQQQKVKIVASRSFKNSHKGFEQLLNWVKPKHKDLKIPLVFNVEATGVYYENLSFYLQKKKQTLSVVLPNKAKKYMESIGLKTKNDKIDAKGLAQMAAEQHLKTWQPATKYYYQLRSLTRHHQAIQESITATKNRLEAVEYSANKTAFVVKSLEKQIKLLNKELKQTEKQIEKQLQKDEQILEKVEQICKIKGVGTLTVAVIIAETFGFELFENYKQLISYAGYDVVENQSGKRSGKTKISKKGNSRIRRILFMPAFNMVTYQQTAFYNLYIRTFAKHGIAMKSYVAIQKKLLTTIYALWKKNEAYDNDYLSKLKEKNMAENLQAITV